MVSLDLFRRVVADPLAIAPALAASGLSSVVVQCTGAISLCSRLCPNSSGDNCGGVMPVPDACDTVYLTNLCKISSLRSADLGPRTSCTRG